MLGWRTPIWEHIRNRKTSEDLEEKEVDKKKVRDVERESLAWA